MCLLRYKTVAFSGNSSNILPAAAQAVELLADRSNRYLQVMAACYDRGFPNAVIELFIGKNFVRIAGEKSKKIKLQSGKIAFCTGICHNAAPGVNLQISKCDSGGIEKTSIPRLSEQVEMDRVIKARKPAVRGVNSL